MQDMLTRMSLAQVRYSRVLVLAAFGLLLFVLLKTAWMCDDSFITLRTVDNFVNGYGPVWNVGERVQAYTHPLWMLLLSFFYFFTHSAYLMPIALSILMTVGLALLLRRLAANELTAVAAILLLLMSRSFVDFSTSGLENPLSHLIFAAFALFYLREPLSDKRPLILSLLLSAALLTRMDSLLIYAPAMLWVVWTNRSWRSVKLGAVGLTPFLLWELFSFFYYGLPYANTALAKLNTGIASADLITQGFRYLKYSLSVDPVAACLLGLGIASAVFSRRMKYLLLALGLVLYLAYIVRIGGDFMSGRFLSLPVVVAIAILLRHPVQRRSWAKMAVVVGIAILGLSQPTCPLRTGACYSATAAAKEWYYGIANERASHFKWVGLFAEGTSWLDQPTHPWLDDGYAVRAVGDTVLLGGGIGYVGFAAGPKAHIIDLFGLAEPLLSRLPVAHPKAWRIGHFLRIVPRGYEQSVRADSNLIRNPDLAVYYDSLRFVVSGPLRSWHRLVTSLRLYWGSFDDYLKSYTSGPMLVLRYKEFNHPFPDGTVFNCRACEVIPRNGVLTLFDSAVHEPMLIAGFDHDDAYKLTFINGTDSLGTVTVAARRIDGGGLRRTNIEVPDDIVVHGFDRVYVTSERITGRQSIGYLLGVQEEYPTTLRDVVRQEDLTDRKQR